MRDYNDFAERPNVTNCGVTEEQFPIMKKCCIHSPQGSLQRFQGLCPSCKAWTLLPTGGKLEVATIFECGEYGYCRRMKE